jgi:CelD/BcsL family acetyltransferase involved in cellulose biosynthesis
MEVAGDWQHLELIGGDANDVPLSHLCQQLAARDLLVHRRAGLACYVIPIRGSWQEYLASRSKTTRRRLRRQIKQCGSSDFELVICHDRESISSHWSDLVCLHQKRRSDLGTEGCFDDTTFGDFLHSAALELADAEMTELLLLQYRGQPAAVELCFVSSTTTYYYQSGMDPDLAHHYPGLMLLAFTAKRAADRGAEALDMLRGEETYKIRWHGRRLETVEIRAASTAWQARLRQQAWQTGAALKDWLKSTTLLAPFTPQD